MSKDNSSSCAVLLGDPNSETSKMLREILRSLSIREMQVVESVEHLNVTVQNIPVSLIVLEDKPSYPLPLVMRHLHTSPLCVLSPILAIFNETTRSEKPYLEQLSRPMLTPKPLTPAKIANAFKSMYSVWQSPNYQAISAATLTYRWNKSDGIKQLIAASKAQPVSSFINSALPTMIAKSGQVDVAEKILLSSLKNTPRDVGLICALSQLYIEYAMPGTALQLIQNFEAHASHKSAVFAYDILQASIMLNKLDLFLDTLIMLKQKNYELPFIQDWIARCYMSEGHKEKALAMFDGEIKKQDAARWA